MFLSLTYTEHCCSASWTGTFSRWFTIFHSNSSGTFDLSLTSTFHTVTCCHGKIEYYLILGITCELDFTFLLLCFISKSSKNTQTLPVFPLKPSFLKIIK